MWLVFGSTFDPLDILAYLVGGVIAGVTIWIIRKMIGFASSKRELPLDLESQ